MSDPQTFRASPSSSRSQRRDRHIEAGLDELAAWLQDRIATGFATPPTREDWQAIAARMTDAQAPGLAKRLRKLADLSSRDPGWHARLLSEVGQIWAIVAAYPQRDRLSPELRAEVRSQVGWQQRQADLRQQSGIRDRWLVLGRYCDRESTGATVLNRQRTWFWATTQHRFALRLDYVHHRQPLPPSPEPGTLLDAELVFYAGAFPLRAIVKSQWDSQSADFRRPAASFPGVPDINTGLCAYADALGQNPWCDRFPLALAAVVPTQSGTQSGIQRQLGDRHGQTLPLSPQFERRWQLLALSGGHPLSLFGEWNGEALLPLAAVAAGRLVSF